MPRSITEALNWPAQNINNLSQHIIILILRLNIIF